ncbi:DUF58 domain-containing protein [Haloterrigena salifodinae]|uniref:DUF58 domain-containing protein n=1 Tax=Haloterrigena salifodinae TaxID=2675099 RepID=A0A8T8DYF3_9EURY|nr:DUF58 domain-containing protein [Haloterrigena salifodinae]QRV14608.1 DUF58 domain-containing protein [Haloterrigena salifodinae]
MTTRRTTRWNLSLAAAMLTSGTGVLLAEPMLLLVSIPGVVFATYSHVTSAPTPTLEFERSLTDSDPSHGDPVEVTVTLRNAGDRTLPNVCLADGVPPMLSVRNGSARHAAALGPGDETTFSYTVTAKHGVHRFGPASAVLEDASRSIEVGTTVEEETELACRSPVRTVSLGRIAHRHAGATATTDGESGIEFSTVRSYRPGDSPASIDWNRYARDGELTTVSFRENRSQATVLCLDARNRCYRSTGRGEPHAVLYERAAARELLEAISESDGPIGLAVFGTEFHWVTPNTGSRHAAMLRRTLEDGDVLPLEPPDERNSDDSVDGGIRTLRTRIDRGTGVVLCSPLLDDGPLEIARALRADGHPVTVLSPDVTAAESLGTDLARIRRDNRIDALRRASASVVDWDPATPLEAAIRNEVTR